MVVTARLFYSIKQRVVNPVPLSLCRRSSMSKKWRDVCADSSLTVWILEATSVSFLDHSHTTVSSTSALLTSCAFCSTTPSALLLGRRTHMPSPSLLYQKFLVNCLGSQMSFLFHSIILLDFYGTFKALIYYNSELKAVLGCQTGHTLKGVQRPGLESWSLLHFCSFTNGVEVGMRST